MKKSTSGFTLVEMLVTIAAAALVMLAVSSLFLTGLRLEKSGSETVAAQRDSRVVLTMLENIAAEGQIDKIEYDASDWSIQKKTNAEYETILSYDSSAQTINGKDGGVIVDEVSFADIYYDSKLLKCSITNASGESYSTSVFCRVGSVESDGISVEVIEKLVDEEKVIVQTSTRPSMSGDEIKMRYAFLVTLLSQYGSTGLIDDSGSDYNGLYYSRWYNLEWGKGTAWCACFLSWGLSYQADGARVLSSGVPHVMFAQFNNEHIDWELVQPGYNPQRYIDNYDYYGGEYTEIGTCYLPGEDVIPIPGDLVFFERGDDDDCPDHIGCVLYVDTDNGRVYTIEGNNNNRVGIFSYSLNPENDKDSEMYIVGYGAIDWDNLPKSSSEN